MIMELVIQDSLEMKLVIGEYCKTISNKHNYFKNLCVDTFMIVHLSLSSQNNVRLNVLKDA